MLGYTSQSCLIYPQRYPRDHAGTLFGASACYDIEEALEFAKQCLALLCFRGAGACERRLR